MKPQQQQQPEYPSELIRCGDHKLAPWHMTCRHLRDQRIPARLWVRVDLRPADTREVDADWVCQECDAEIREGGEPAMSRLVKEMSRPDKERTLVAVCMHCLNNLKRQAGFVQDEFGRLAQPPA